jgi:hypothetical protein
MLTKFPPSLPKWKADSKEHVKCVQTTANTEPGKLQKSSLQCTVQSVTLAFV